VSHLLGCHIEVDYPSAPPDNPTNLSWEMTVDPLRDLRRAVTEVGDQPGRYVLDDFIIHHLES